MEPQPWFEQFKMERQVEMVGYGQLIGSLIRGAGYVFHQIAWLVDLRRMSIVIIIMLGMGLLAFLATKELAFQRAQGESRCRRIKNQFGRGNQATAIVSKNNARLMTISYDMYSKLSKSECSCATGNVLNAIWFKYFDFKSRTISNNSINCMCDTDYALAPGGYVYTGHPKLVQFMQTGARDDAKELFGVVTRGGSGVSASYNKSINFTCPLPINAPSAANGDYYTLPNSTTKPADLVFTMPSDAITIDSVSYTVTYKCAAIGATPNGLKKLTVRIVDANNGVVPNTESDATKIRPDVVVDDNAGENVVGSFVFNSAIIPLQIGSQYSMQIDWKGPIANPLVVNILLNINYQKMDSDTVGA